MLSKFQSDCSHSSAENMLLDKQTCDIPHTADDIKYCHNLGKTEMNTQTFLRYTCAALAIATSAVLAQSGQTVERYSKLPASADGIGKGYMGREIAAVMGWQGAAWLSAKSVIGKSVRTCY